MRELPVIHRSRGLVCLSARAFIINRFDISFILMLWTLCINLSNASAFLVPPLCLLWPTNSVHWAITVATTVPPFGDHGNPSATLAMVLPPLCLLCATCCATTAALVVQGRHKGRAAAVTQKQNFLGLGDHWASWPFFWSLKGGTKVAALCKGGVTYTGTEIGTWISNYIQTTQWDVISHPYSDYKSGLTKPPLKLGRGWIITSK